MRRSRFFNRGTAAACVAAIAAGVWLRCAPLPAGLLDLNGTASTVVVDRHGELLYEARAGDGSRTSRLAAGALPPTLVDATVAAEDVRFWRHPGLDPIGIVRAVVHDIRDGAIVEGGSTITQQVAKLLRVRSGRGHGGLAAKMAEAALALRLEHHLSKREILALYLNLASYGNQLVGAERASREYFGRGAESLTPAQAAFLAALPQRPSTFNPYRSEQRAKARQQNILTRMARAGFLTGNALAQALDEHLTLQHEPAAFVAPHFVQRVLEAGRPVAGGRIETTLDAGLQRDVQGVIRSQRLSLARHGAHNVAVVVLDNATGEWLAWEGSGNYDDSAHGGTIDGVVTPRQPGSALKPLTYALAFESGDTPASVLPDVPSSFPTANPGVVYRPSNYDGRFRGPLRARLALAGSENVPAVALASKIGVADLLRFLRRAGLGTLDKSPSYYGLGVTLGDAEVRLDQLVAAYAAFARGGTTVVPRFVRRGAGEEEGPPAAGEPLVSTRTAFWISDVLSDSHAREYAFGRDSSLDFAFPVAAKTGTSQAYRDNWTIGYTRAVTVGVWVGNFDRTPLIGSSGVTGAGPIFHDVMNAAVRRVTGTAPPDGEPPTRAAADGLERRAICALSGLLAGPACPAQVEEWLPSGAVVNTCDWHSGSSVDWPTEYRAWAHERGLVATADPSRGVAHSRGVTIVNPPEGATYSIDPTLRMAFQTLGLRAVADAAGRLEWTVDGARVGTSESGARLEWPLTPGAHAIAVRDRTGRRAETHIVVK